MRHFKSILILAALGISTGCVGVTSLHPLFPDSSKEVKFDPVLLGKWQHQDPDMEICEITKLDGKTYAAAFQMDGKPATATLHLVKTHGLTLLDVVYSDTRGPEHTFWKIRIQPDTLWVTTADTQWLRDQIVARGKPSYQVVDGGLLLTAPSAALRKALLPYLAKPEAFETEDELKRLK